MTNAAQEGRPFNASRVQTQRAAYEQAWQHATDPLPTTPQGGVLPTVRAALDTYAPNTTTIKQRYSMVPNMAAAASVALLAQPTWSRDVGTMAWLCDLDPSCGGFTSQGVLASGLVLLPGGMQPTPGVRVYIKAA
jgi:hypothetical protein